MVLLYYIEAFPLSAAGVLIAAQAIATVVVKIINVV